MHPACALRREVRVLWRHEHLPLLVDSNTKFVFESTSSDRSSCHEPLLVGRAITTVDDRLMRASLVHGRWILQLEFEFLMPRGYGPCN